MAIVTLTTDFGTSDGYVGAMKGVLCSRAPGVTLVDIAHDIPRQDVAAAAFALTNAIPYFPAGTIHVAVVDPGVGSARRAVIASDRRQLFVGPDNGIFSLVAPRPEEAYEIAAPAFRLESPSATFHGRDLFAAAAARLAAGGHPKEAGPEVSLQGKLPQLSGAGRLAGARVLHVDVFGNLITDLPGDLVPAGASLRVAQEAIGGLSLTYESVEEGELLAYVGSRGTVEIAVRGGSACERLGAGRGTPVEIVKRGEGGA